MAAEKKSFPKFHVYDAGGDTNQRWYVQYIDQDGRRRKKYAGINEFDNAEARRLAAKRVIEDLKMGSPRSSLILRAKAWIESKKAKWRKKTYQTNKSKLDNLILWLGPRKPTEETIKAFFDHILSTRSATTYNAYRHVLSSIFKGIGEERLLLSVENIPSSSNPAKYFQSHQIARIKRRIEAEDAELWLFIQFIYYCFIRPGELRLLKVEDINFDEWKIVVRSDISKNKKMQHVSIPTAFREAVAILTERDPSEYVFQKRGRPVAINNMSKRHRRFLNELGFSVKHKLYSWKHTGAVQAVKSGIGVKELQIQLRHSSLQEVDNYLRQLGVMDLGRLDELFPSI